VAEQQPVGDLAPPDERGSTTIADRVVERIATIAAGEVDSVTDTDGSWARLGRRGLPRAHATVAGLSSRISVEVAAAWPTPLGSLATRVRDHVCERVETLTGVSVTAVDVRVADVVHLETAQRRVQ